MPDVSSDPLLSVYDVARLWGSGLASVLRCIECDQLRSIDRGLLVSEGHYDIPLIRRSWAEAVQTDSPGASRRIDEEGRFHPALEPAFDFHKALDLGDVDGVRAVSSVESRERFPSPGDLLQAWREVGGHLVQPGSGIGTAIYSLAPLDAVAARVMADAPAMPRAFSKPTPVSMLDALPLVLEGDRWWVDLPLFERRQDWLDSLTEPPPEPGGSSAPSDESDSSDSS